MSLFNLCLTGGVGGGLFNLCLTEGDGGGSLTCV